MKKFIAAAMLNFNVRSSQTARALLTGSSPGLLDLWNYKQKECYLTTFLSITREFYRPHSTVARLYDAAASQA